MLRSTGQVPRAQIQDAGSIGAQQFFFQRASEAQVADRLDRRIDAVGNIRKVAAEYHAVLELQHPTDGRRAAQIVVEHHSRIQVHAAVEATQVEERVELVGSSVSDNHAEVWIAPHEAEK